MLRRAFNQSPLQLCYYYLMKKLLVLPVLLHSLFVGSAAFSADFDKGMNAYRSGDYATALREWTPLAKQGHALAQHNLGVMYAKGQGIPRNYKTATTWYTLAAEKGDVSAQYSLGWMYDKGVGVLQNDKTAVKWYTLAAKQGYAGAQGNLGAMYAFGRGVTNDYVEAYKWGNLAAAKGNERAERLMDMVAKLMTPTQVKTAQDLARECVKKNYKRC